MSEAGGAVATSTTQVGVKASNMSRSEVTDLVHKKERLAQKKKSERNRTERRAGCSHFSAASEEVSRTVAMASGRCNKHETKSVPAKLPWQLSERASARLSWRVSFIFFSYYDSRLRKSSAAASRYRRSRGLQAAIKRVINYFILPSLLSRSK